MNKELEFFNTLLTYAQSEYLADDSINFENELNAFMLNLSNANLKWHKPFPAWQPDTYQTVFNDVTVTILVNSDCENYPMVLCHNSKILTVCVNHVDCLKCIVEF